MLGFLRQKSSKKRSVLAKQKVRSAQKSGALASSSGAAWSVAAKGLVVVFCGVIVWGLGIRIYDKIGELGAYVNSALVLSPREWRIEVVATNGTHLAEELRRDVYKTASRSLRTGSPQELRTLARQVEAMGTLESVRVIRPLYDTVILMADTRRPTLLIDVGNKTRLLTADGTVYGDAADSQPNPGTVRPNIKVTGIFDQRPNPATDASQRVIVTTDEKRHLQDALEVWSRVLENKLAVKIINFQKFRGYSLVLDDDTEIIIGLKPFDYKLKKLRDILEGLRRDGIAATRIELDYEGKAFIKERKL